MRVTVRTCSISQPAKVIGDFMAQKKPLNIGLIGYGFMGRTHSNAYKRVNDFFDVEYRPVLKAVCGRTAAGRERFAEKWGYESVETDWRKLVERKDIDAIDICTPNNTHAEIAIAAAEAGKMVLCEKPLAMNLVEGQKMVDAVEKAGVPNTVWYNYRRVPAVTLAKLLIDEGRLGRIFHYRANFLQDWTISADLPQGGAGCLAAGRGGGRLGRHRRPAGPLHRHGALAQRSHQHGLRHDRDLRERAKA